MLTSGGSFKLAGQLVWQSSCQALRPWHISTWGKISRAWKITCRYDSYIRSYFQLYLAQNYLTSQFLHPLFIFKILSLMFLCPQFLWVYCHKPIQTDSLSSLFPSWGWEVCSTSKADIHNLLHLKACDMQVSESNKIPQPRAINTAQEEPAERTWEERRGGIMQRSHWWIHHQYLNFNPNIQ